MKHPRKSMPDLCPCGSGQALALCCGRYHAGAVAPTAEALMRSRYTAYALRLEAYLLATWHPRTRPASLSLEEDAGLKWVGLLVEAAETRDDTAWVRFTARYKANGRAGRLQECSRFVREDGCWYYLDGDVSE